jgi:lipopolysaccharide export system ATP-binding protein
MIKQLSEQNMGIIITDHNVRETLEICDRAYIMHLGKIIAHGSQQEILSDENVRRVYLGDEFKL